MNAVEWIPKGDDECYICKKPITPKTGVCMAFTDVRRLMCLDCVDKLKTVRGNK